MKNIDSLKVHTIRKIFVVLILFCTAETLNAKSDIQISPIFPSLFNNLNTTIEDVNNSHKQFFRIGDSFWRTSNQNYLWNNNFGFYEAVSLSFQTLIPVDYDDSMGLQISGGFAYNIITNDILDFDFNSGPHISIFGHGIVFGIESDLHVKFLPKRRFSPVVGFITNYDFYSSLKAIEYITKIKTTTYDNNYTVREPYTETVEHEIQKYAYFCILPYISFCINLW